MTTTSAPDVLGAALEPEASGPADLASNALLPGTSGGLTPWALAALAAVLALAVGLLLGAVTLATRSVGRARAG